MHCTPFFVDSLVLLVITAHFPVHVAVNTFHFSLTYKLSKWSNLLQKIEAIKFCCGPDLEATQVTQPYLAEQSAMLSSVYNTVN